MTYALLSVFLFLSVTLVIKVGLKAIYVVIVIAFIQNFVLPFLLTTGMINVSEASAALYLKDILCAVLALYALRSMYIYRSPLKLSVIVLAVFTAWCLLRGALGIVMGDDLFKAGRWVRDMCAPLEFVIIGIASAKEIITWPAVHRYVRFMAFIALIALPLAGPLGKNVWGKYINIASYSELVKHEPSAEQDDVEGVNGSGNLSDRGAFANIAQYRAMGTFGEPLSMAFNMAFALMIAMFVLREKRWIAMVLIASALFFSFTRSAWIFFIVGGIFVLVRQLKIWWMLAFITAIASAVIFVEPLRAFVLTTVGLESSFHPHATGIRDFYSETLFDPGVLGGKGINHAQLMESGYGNIVEIFGLPAYVLFMLFCVMAMIDLAGKAVIRIVMQGAVLGTLVVMNFSYYPFAFNPYVVIWLIFGAVVAGTGAGKRPREELAPRTCTGLEAGAALNNRWGHNNA